MPYSFYTVNKKLENGIINVAKLSDRDGFERRAFMLNKKPMSIISPKFKYQCFSINERREEAIRIKEIMSKIPSSDKSQSANDLRGCVEEMEENGFFKEIRHDKFDVSFEVTRMQFEYCDFVKEMELLSQTVKECFDKHYKCETEDEILETVHDYSSSYPQTFKMHPRIFKFSSLFHTLDGDSNLTTAFFKRNGESVKIDADFETFYEETKGELVDVRFVFIPIIYSKNGKYYLRNEVIGIEFSDRQKFVQACPILEDSDED